MGTLIHADFQTGIWIAPNIKVKLTDNQHWAASIILSNPRAHKAAPSFVAQTWVELAKPYGIFGAEVLKTNLAALETLGLDWMCRPEYQRKQG